MIWHNIKVVRDIVLLLMNYIFYLQDYVLFGFSPLIYSQTCNWKSNTEINKCNLLSKLFQDDSNNERNQFVGFVSSHKKGTMLTSFHVHSFVIFHTDLQKNAIVTRIHTARNHIMSNMHARNILHYSMV